MQFQFQFALGNNDKLDNGCLTKISCADFNNKYQTGTHLRDVTYFTTFGFVTINFICHDYEWLLIMPNFFQEENYA